MWLTCLEWELKKLLKMSKQRKKSTGRSLLPRLPNLVNLLAGKEQLLIEKLRYIIILCNLNIIEKKIAKEPTRGGGNRRLGPMRGLLQVEKGDGESEI